MGKSNHYSTILYSSALNIFIQCSIQILVIILRHNMVEVAGKIGLRGHQLLETVEDIGLREQHTLETVVGIGSGEQQRLGG